MASLIIKVCGMTEAENIRNVEQLDVDMIGFIFYPKSPRCLCEMPAYLPVHAKRVGVFVNENKDDILMYTDRFCAGLYPAPRQRIARVLPFFMQQRPASHQGFLHRAPQGFGGRLRLQGIMRLLPV